LDVAEFSELLQKLDPDGVRLVGVRSYRKETNLRRRLGQGSDWHSKQRDGEDDSSSSSRYQEGSPVHDSSSERTGGTARRYGVRRRASSNDPGTGKMCRAVSRGQMMDRVY